MTMIQVHPAHIGFTLINDAGTGDGVIPGGTTTAGGTPLFASVVSRAGGDPVCNSLFVQTYGC